MAKKSNANLIRIGIAGVLVLLVGGYALYGMQGARKLAGTIIEAGRRGVRRILAANGVELRGSVLHDGSGLSRENRLHPQVLVDVLRLATEPDRPDLRPVSTGLPVAGFTGSLADRMDLGPPEGRGRVRAKTGTLTGVTSLAGLATDLEGNAMVFVLMADRVPEDRDYFARVAMDAAAASLGACRCGG